MRPGLVLLALLLSASCSKKEPPPPERTEPWLNTSSTPERATRAAHYRIDPRVDIRFEVPGREGTPRGRLRVAKGEIEVDLANLESARGTVSIDVGSVAMDESEDLSATDATRQAKNWLDVGSSKPEAERERLRWASFEITKIRDASSSSAFSARKVKPKRAPPADAGDAGADADAGNPPAEVRAVRAVAEGRLTFHGFRIERSVPLSIEFAWARDAGASDPPDLIHIRTRKPLHISLRTHDIVPRDAKGVAIASDKKLIGKQVGREARVNLELVARLHGDEKRPGNPAP